MSDESVSIERALGRVEGKVTGLSERLLMAEGEMGGMRNDMKTLVRDVAELKDGLTSDISEIKEAVMLNASGWKALAKLSAMIIAIASPLIALAQWLIHR